jgi:hypothetical protein
MTLSVSFPANSIRIVSLPRNRRLTVASSASKPISLSVSVSVASVPVSSIRSAPSPSW